MREKTNLYLFKEIQESMGVTNSALSALLGVSVATIEKRRAGSVGISDEVIYAMKYLRGEKCPQSLEY